VASASKQDANRCQAFSLQMGGSVGAEGTPSLGPSVSVPSPPALKGVKTRISGSSGGLSPYAFVGRPGSGLFGPALPAQGVVHLLTTGSPSIRFTRA
jgi:hypothetical protein